MIIRYSMKISSHFVPIKILHLWGALGIFPWHSIIHSCNLCSSVDVKYHCDAFRATCICGLACVTFGGSFIPRNPAVTGVLLLVPLHSATISPCLVEQ